MRRRQRKCGSCPLCFQLPLRLRAYLRRRDAVRPGDRRLLRQVRRHRRLLDERVDVRRVRDEERAHGADEAAVPVVLGDQRPGRPPEGLQRLVRNQRQIRRFK